MRSIAYSLGGFLLVLFVASVLFISSTRGQPPPNETVYGWLVTHLTCHGNGWGYGDHN